ncbi:MAG: type II secretion system protein [Candidatus Hydrogenedentes bacterium]|nr:type II secretion system protein [Candidatus Hydrogenedentota bacterium]
MVAAQFIKTRRAFTLVEVLAAMIFMSIVISVAVRALTVSNRDGVIAERKRVAARLADSIFTESVATDSWRDGDTDGTFDEPFSAYSWTIESETWPEDTMDLVSIVVSFDVQGREYTVRFSTLVEETSETTAG